MQLSLKRYDWRMCRIGNITYTLSRKGNIWHIIFVCEGEVLLKQWKQGNIVSVKLDKDF